MKYHYCDEDSHQRPVSALVNQCPREPLCKTGGNQFLFVQAEVFDFRSTTYGFRAQRYTSPGPEKVLCRRCREPWSCACVNGLPSCQVELSWVDLWCNLPSWRVEEVGCEQCAEGPSLGTVHSGLLNSSKLKSHLFLFLISPCFPSLDFNSSRIKSSVSLASVSYFRWSFHCLETFFFFFNLGKKYSF